MIAFGCSIVLPECYERYAELGIRLAREHDSEVLALRAAGSIFRSHNLILEQAAAFDDLEALVLVHEDAEILDASFCETLREVLRDPEVGVVGCVGAIGVHSIAWWEGETVGSFVHRYQELGGGVFLAFSPNGNQPVYRPSTREVDTVDGFTMALSPWVVRNIRFDESLGPHWGYDLDFCSQVRAAKRKVVTADLKVAHHHSLALVRDPEPWMAAHMRVAEKWDRVLNPGETEVDWKQRARRAEAEAVVARLHGAWKLMQANARAADHERRLSKVTQTRSWRLTAPLRRLNALRKAHLHRR